MFLAEFNQLKVIFDIMVFHCPPLLDLLSALIHVVFKKLHRHSMTLNFFSNLNFFSAVFCSVCF